MKRLSFALISTLAGWLLAAPAQAVVILPEEDTPPSVDRVWVVASSTESRTVVWITVSSQGPGRLGLVVPLSAGTQVDPGDPAWTETIELSTAPRVLPPEDAELPSCAPEEPAVHVVDDEVAERVGNPEAIVVAGDGEALAAAAEAQHLLVTSAAAAAIDDMSGTDELLLLVYEVPSEAQLQSVRVVQPAVGTVPFGSLRSGLFRDLGATVIVFAEHGVVPTELDCEDARDLDFVWYGEQGVSQYPLARENRLREIPGSCVTEPVGYDLFYDWQSLPDDAGVIKSLPHDYLEQSVGSVTLRDDCLAVIQSIRQAGLTVAPACVEGAFHTSANPLPCGETSEEAPMDPATLVCGDATELALAHSGMAPDIVVSRHVARISQDSPLELHFGAASQQPSDQVVRARSVDEGDCPSGDPSSGNTGGTSGAFPGTVGPPLGSAPPVYYDPDDYYDEDHDHYYVDAVVVVEDDSSSCSGSSEDDDDYDGETCGGDGSGDGCSGSSDDDYDGETCGGDGSGDGCSGSSDDDYDGETCGGDGSGDGCSGDGSDSGYDGETCSGDCSVSPRFRFPRLSALAVLLCGVLFVLRRVFRPRSPSNPLVVRVDP